MWGLSTSRESPWQTQGSGEGGSVHEGREGAHPHHVSPGTQVLLAGRETFSYRRLLDLTKSRAASRSGSVYGFNVTATSWLWLISPITHPLDCLATCSGAYFQRCTSAESCLGHGAGEEAPEHSFLPYS